MQIALAQSYAASAEEGEGSQAGATPPPSGQGEVRTPRTPGGTRQDTLRDKERKIGHRRVGEGGLVTYKKVGGGFFV